MTDLDKLNDLSLQEFYDQLRNDIDSSMQSTAEDAPTGQESAFATRAVQILQRELAVSDETLTAHCDMRKKQAGLIHGLGVYPDRGYVEVISAIYDGSTTEPTTLTNTQVRKRINESYLFCKKIFSQEPLTYWADQGWPLYPDIKRLYDEKDQIENINIILVSNYLHSAPDLEDMHISKKDLFIDTWDIKKLYETEKGEYSDHIEIDFAKEFDQNLPCVEIPSQPGYQGYMASIPGPILYQLYEKYRTRLLGDNVRYYLQATGKINRQILNTINTEPRRFFAYNNGLSTTARSVKVSGRNSANPRITSLTDWQILNGGQTTASIHLAGSKDINSITDINIPIKIITSETMDKSFVSSISKFSNSQNQIKPSDLYSNYPHFKAIQKLSRATYVQTPGATRSRWYFERTRGQYKSELERLTGGAKKFFGTQNPTQQKFDKLQLAIALNSWEQMPHTACLGAEKNFDDYVNNFDPSIDTLNESEYVELIGQLIIFRQTDRIVKSIFGGELKSKIVPYCVSGLSFITKKQLDIPSIYENQGFTDIMESTVNEIVKHGNSLIFDGARKMNYSNIGEWCKRSACWDYVRKGFSGISVDQTMLREDTKKFMSISEGSYIEQWTEFFTHIQGDQWNKIKSVIDSFGTLQISDKQIIKGFRPQQDTKRQHTIYRSEHILHRAAEDPVVPNLSMELQEIFRMIKNLPTP